jgi:hypothetical protein
MFGILTGFAILGMFGGAGEHFAAAYFHGYDSGLCSLLQPEFFTSSRLPRIRIARLQI